MKNLTIILYWIALLLACLQFIPPRAAFAERLMSVWDQAESAEPIELIADPKFDAGISAIPACNGPDRDPTCANGDRYALKTPFRPEAADIKPVWEVAQWGSRSNIAAEGQFFGDGYGWTNSDKRLVIYPEGRVELAVNGQHELDGNYKSDRSSLPNLILQQTITAPGTYARETPSLANMKNLIFNLDFRKMYDDQNIKPGYDSDRHAIIFPVNFSIQNLNQRAPGYGEYVWLSISTYDDRYFLQTQERDRTQIDLGTKRLIYHIPPFQLSRASTHRGEWVRFHGDILPFAKRAVEMAYEKGMIQSPHLSDYKIGGMNIGYELTGLNVAIFQFRGLSVKALSRQRRP